MNLKAKMVCFYADGSYCFLFKRGPLIGRQTFKYSTVKELEEAFKPHCGDIVFRKCAGCGEEFSTVLKGGNTRRYHAACGNKAKIDAAKVKRPIKWVKPVAVQRKKFSREGSFTDVQKALKKY